MSATPSEEAMLIAEDWIEHSGMSYHGCGERGSGCGCGAPSRQNGLAIDIAALVARRVEEERERCAVEAMSLHVYDDERPQAYVKGWCDAAKVIAAAIRTTPTN